MSIKQQLPMSEPNHFYPQHITEMLSELEQSVLADTILSVYHCKTISDPILQKIYTLLNYPHVNEISSQIVIRLIQREYMADFPPIDMDYPAHLLYDNHSDPIESLPLDLDFQEELMESRSTRSDQMPERTRFPMTFSKDTPFTSQRSKNGLKILSWKVKEIVEKLGSSTYQEVADYLINDENESKSKEEKNIRRRVYDALNVLIAVGVLKKHSKRVEPVQKPPKQTEKKIKRLKDLSEKFLKLKALIERNKKLKKSFQNLYLPFSLIVIPDTEETQIKIKTALQRSNVVVKLDKKFSIRSSDEILKNINVECEESWLPLDIRSFYRTSQYKYY